MKQHPRWTDWYPSVSPVPSELRRAHPNEWLRVYLLPGGKRYPESPDDVTEARMRRDAVLSATFSEGEHFEAFLGRYFEPPAPLVVCGGLNASYFRTEPGEPGERLALYSLSGTWNLLALHAVLDDIMMGREPPWVFLSTVNGDALAPYNGGVDLFIRDDSRRSAARSRFAQWLSPRGDGL